MVDIFKILSAFIFIIKRERNYYYNCQYKRKTKLKSYFFAFRKKKSIYFELLINHIKTSFISFTGNNYLKI